MAYTRYRVVIPGKRTVYKGSVRLYAWLIWQLYRHKGAEAYDGGIWVIEPASWLTCGTPLSERGDSAGKYNK
jgi:hypothetical protein